MSERYDCEETRAHYHQVRRGDVTPEELLAYDDHLSDCEACQAFVLRMDGMLEAAATVDVVDEIGIDRDDLFARIMGEVDELEEAENETPAPALREVDDEPIEIPRSPRRWAAIVALAAAVIVAALGVSMWLEQAPDSPLEPLAEKSTDEQEASPDPKTTDPKAPRLVEGAPMVELANLARVETSDEDVRLFSADDTSIDVESKPDETTISLERGTLLVEFAPQKKENLSVVTGDLTVRVVGTIFYVHSSDSGSVVGVVTGKVEVSTEDGQRLFLTDGQSYDPVRGLRTTASEELEPVDAYVDVDNHRAKSVPAKPVSAPSHAPKTKVETTFKATEDAPKSPEDQRASNDKASMSVLAQTLRDQAAEAVRLRQYQDAARLLEELIVELPSGHPAAMSARLDLARIYMRQLDRPDQAVPHLKRFIVDRPNDPAAPSARTTLCRILEASNESDPACEEP